MPKDYKDAPSPRGESKLSHPMLLGVIIGLLLGVIISLAVALWLNRLSNPFLDKGKPLEPLPKLSNTQPPPPPEAAKTAADKAKGVPDKGAEKGKPPEKGEKAREGRPRFEFYNILPGEKEVTEKEVKAAKAAAAPPGAPKPGSSPTAPKAFSGEIYWLQAGAFGSEGDADNLKAKIALIGLEALVRPVSTADKGTLYRVRLGPFQSLDAANRIKVALSQNGVGAAIIRTTDEPKKE